MTIPTRLSAACGLFLFCQHIHGQAGAIDPTFTLVLAWPGVYNNHILQSTPNLSSDGWTSVTNPVVPLANGMNCVTNPVHSSGSRFFRLIRPASALNGVLKSSLNGVAAGASVQ